MRNLDLPAIRVVGDTQARVAIDENTVSEYADALSEEGGDLPPVIVFSDGTDYWVGDGHHRHLAYTRAGRASIPADVRVGTQRDAILYACGANTQHGLRRSQEDKRKAVGILLADPEWSQWSDREIARRCSVHHELVGRLREHLAETPDSKRLVERGGTTYEQDTTKIGKGSTAKGAGTIAEPVPHGGNVTTPRAQAGSAPTPAGASPAAPKPRTGAGEAPQPPTTGADDAIQPEKTEAEQQAEEEFGDTSLAELVDEQAKEIDALRRQIEALTVDDQKAETLKWRQSYELARKAKDDLQQRVVDREAELKRCVSALRRCGQSMGEDDPLRVPAAVEAFVRNAKLAA